MRETGRGWYLCDFERERGGREIEREGEKEREREEERERERERERRERRDRVVCERVKVEGNQSHFSSK